MKIYTRTGDNGTTSLVGGTRINKDDPRLEAYGTADELNSFIGLMMAKLKDDETDMRDLLLYLQNRLFNLGTLLATEPESKQQQWVQELYLTDADCLKMEQAIDKISESLPVIRGFILPSGNERVALSHVCRTVTRRLERRMISLIYADGRQPNPDELIALKFVNRVSDFFFVLAKKIGQNDNCEIFLWKK